MLTGKVIIVKEAKNKSIQGKRGLVLDETRNTITIQEGTKNITIIKDQTITIEEHHG